VIAPPEPGLTAEEVIRRAEDLVPVLRARQAECEELGRLPDETVSDLIERGFYRVLQPRRFGGYELELPVFSRVAIELARGCPSTGWTYALVAGHAHMLSALFGEECQVDVYGEDGDVRMPGNLRFLAEAVPVDGGFRITGAWDYISGCDSATHLVLGAEVPALGSEGAREITCIADAKECTIVDNWDVLGMRGTGSKRVVADGVFVPAHRTVGSLFDPDFLLTAPGRRVHENPFFATGSFFNLLFSEITAVAVGTARGALDVYEEILSTRMTTLPPIVPMREHPDYHRFYGEAVQLLEVAQAAFLSADRDYMECARRAAEEGTHYDPELDQRQILQKQLCSKLADDAVELMVRTVGSSPMRTGETMQRYRRDMTMLCTHNGAQAELAAGRYGRLHFGVELAQ
jgi:3-hydroxy-9,10-secoandrosta-1,3,5(10)-triene-9,17-dione monooxygenase